MPVLIMNCELCNKLYRGGIFPSRSTRFCSFICFGKSLEAELIKTNCLTCNKEFLFKKFKSRGKFCNRKCIRYGGSEGSKKWRIGKGFWQTANQEEKFQKKKELFNKLVIKKEGCWKWKNVLDSAGYSRINCGNRSSVLGHRVSWLIHKGEIPEGLFVCHACDNPGCTNPEHLFLGTAKDNTHDCLNKNRRIASSGSNHYNVKLTEEQVIEIKRLIKLRYSQSTLGNMFKVSPSTIQNIADGKTWKNI